MEHLWNDTAQIPETVDVGKAIVASIDNLLCGISLVLMFIYSLKVAIIVRSRSSPYLHWDETETRRSKPCIKLVWEENMESSFFFLPWRLEG
jgi:hypothetical protein